MRGWHVTAVSDLPERMVAVSGLFFDELCSVMLGCYVHEGFSTPLTNIRQIVSVFGGFA